jgi:CheY-like chemotaxis protein
MGKVAIVCLAARGTLYSPFVRHVKRKLSLCFRLYRQTGSRPGNPVLRPAASRVRAVYTRKFSTTGVGTLSEVGILIIDDDVASQRALKHVLDSEGWRVRIVPLAAHALTELATGAWNLVIVNVSLIDLRGPLFAILKDLSQVESAGPEDIPAVAPQLSGNGSQPSEAESEGAVVVAKKCLRVLYLVPVLAAKQTQPVLEREGLPYSLKPYHLHDFLEKVSELLVEAGAIVQPIRSIGGFSSGRKVMRARRVARDSRRGTMFASREDYQMSEEELTEWEKQEEEDRKKREKEKKDREHL